MDLREAAITLAGIVDPNPASIADHKALTTSLTKPLDAIARLPLNQPSIWKLIQNFTQLSAHENSGHQLPPALAIRLATDTLHRIHYLLSSVNEEELQVYSIVLDFTANHQSLPVNRDQIQREAQSTPILSPSQVDQALRNLTMRKFIAGNPSAPDFNGYSPVFVFYYPPIAN